MLILKNEILRYKIQIYILCLIILFFIFRASNPLFKYPFILLYISILPALILRIKEQRGLSLKPLVREFIPVFLFFLVFFLAFLFSNKLYLIVFKEIVSILLLFSFLLFINILVSSKNDLLLFLQALIKLIVIFSVFIAAAGILDLFGILSYMDYFLVEKSFFRSIPYDTNFSLLPLVFSIIAIVFYILNKEYPILRIFLFELLLLFFSFYIFLSGSRRGILALLIITCIVLLVLIFSFIRKKTMSIKAKTASGIFVLIVCFQLTGFYFFVTKVPFLTKNNFLNFIGTKDLTYTKEKISNNIFKIYKIVGNKLSLRDLHEKTWSMRFNPFDPDLGWGGMGIHKTVFPLTGTNSEIVPAGSKGYLIDSTFEASTWDGDAYSITMLGRLKGEESIKVRTSLYCYVSHDYNSDWLKLILLNTKKRELHCDYDLNHKGTWQLLSLEDTCSAEYCEARFQFANFGTEDLTSMNGFVIIAFPQFEKFDEKGLIESFYEKNPVDSSFLYQHQYSSPDTIIKLSLFDLSELNRRLMVEDPLRKWIKKVFAEDTTYTGFKTKLIPDSVNLPLPDNRTTRWKIALRIYSGEYNMLEKITGGGFKHLNWYGYIFLKNKTISDWPHNPFLSVLLYSGLIGLILYIFILYKTILYYVRYIRIMPLPFIFFIVTFIFSFVSGDSPFDPPIMGFFILLPFLIHNIHKNDPVKGKAEFR